MRILTIGRSSSCDIVIPDDRISRIHGEISIIGNQYVYYDRSTNGTNIGGQIYKNQKVVLAPGADILLSNIVPFPWERVYIMLPISSNRENPTINYPVQNNNNYTANQSMKTYEKDELSIVVGIIAFLLPLVGFILYFVWKGDTPQRANQVLTTATVGFVLNLILILTAS